MRMALLKNQVDIPTSHPLFILISPALQTKIFNNYGSPTRCDTTCTDGRDKEWYLAIERGSDCVLLFDIDRWTWRPWDKYFFASKWDNYEAWVSGGPIFEMRNTVDAPTSEPECDATDNGNTLEEAAEIKTGIGEVTVRTPQQRAWVVAHQVQKQIATRAIKAGYHHGRLNPLLSTCFYPKGIIVLASDDKYMALRQCKGIRSALIKAVVNQRQALWTQW